MCGVCIRSWLICIYLYREVGTQVKFALLVNHVWYFQLLRVRVIFFKTLYVEQFSTQRTNVPFIGEFLTTEEYFINLKAILPQSPAVFLLWFEHNHVQTSICHLKASIVGFHGYIRGVKADCCSVQSRPALLSMRALSPVWKGTWLDSCKMCQAPV